MNAAAPIQETPLATGVLRVRHQGGARVAVLDIDTKMGKVQLTARLGIKGPSAATGLVYQPMPIPDSALLGQAMNYVAQNAASAGLELAGADPVARTMTRAALGDERAQAELVALAKRDAKYVLALSKKLAGHVTKTRLSMDAIRARALAGDFEGLRQSLRDHFVKKYSLPPKQAKLLAYAGGQAPIKLGAWRMATGCECPDLLCEGTSCHCGCNT